MQNPNLWPKFTVLRFYHFSFYASLPVRLLILTYYPTMYSSPSRIDPEQVFESKVLSECPVEHLDGHRHELPALEADVGPGAARSNVVVIRHVDIKDQLLLHGLEVADFIVVRRSEKVEQNKTQIMLFFSSHYITK